MSTWEEAAEGNNNMSDGYHLLKCVKVMRSKKDGTEFKTSKGDPSLLAIFANADGDEATNMYTLAPQAKNFLARDLSRLGANLKNLEADGVKIDSFVDEDFAAKVFVGKKGYAKVTASGQYVDIVFMHENELPINVLQDLKKQAPGVQKSLAPEKPVVDEEDIPF